MRIEIQLRIIADDNSVISEGKILHLDKGDDRLEVIGLSFDEARRCWLASRDAFLTERIAPELLYLETRWASLASSGMTAVTMLTDGGDSVRALAGELSPGAVAILDWFHIAMRLTGLDQYVKGLAHHNPVEALALQHRMERIQWRLWHGDDDEALTRAQALAADFAALNTAYPGLKR